MPRTRKTLLTATVALALGTSGTVLYAAGGGGGGGSIGGAPSSSAPRYDATAEYRKGVAALEAGEHKDAIRALKRSLSAAPRNANAHYLLGVAYMRSGDDKKARKPLEKAVKYDDSLIGAHRDLAIVWHRLGKPDKASESYNALLAKKNACGDSCAQKDELGAALTAVRAAMNGADAASLMPLPGFGTVEGDALYLGAVGLINEGRYEEALGELADAARAFGPHPDVLTYLGFANRKLQRFDLAEDYYLRALAVAPDHLGAIEYYGELKVERGDLEGAKAHLARLNDLCSFGCYEAEELGRWIAEAERS